ncbi:unnamed protein product [Danaus chrysippus]|uniref:(African queen) hypothetical protein n=1 Tax=Danaus chrysippus TaxID=151541 RepID=A0A8J2R187_9NEOP|nr:unnamed protein product [Danaus chrysippus]
MDSKSLNQPFGAGDKEKRPKTLLVHPYTEAKENKKPKKYLLETPTNLKRKTPLLELPKDLNKKPRLYNEENDTNSIKDCEEIGTDEVSSSQMIDSSIQTKADCKSCHHCCCSSQPVKVLLAPMMPQMFPVQGTPFIMKPAVEKVSAVNLGY